MLKKLSKKLSKKFSKRKLSRRSKKNKNKSRPANVPPLVPLNENHAASSDSVAGMSCDTEDSSSVITQLTNRVLTKEDAVLLSVRSGSREVDGSTKLEPTKTDGTSTGGRDGGNQVLPEVPSADDQNAAAADATPDLPDDTPPKVNVPKVEAQEAPDVPRSTDELKTAADVNAAPTALEMNTPKVEAQEVPDDPDPHDVPALEMNVPKVLEAQEVPDVSNVPDVPNTDGLKKTEAIDAAPTALLEMNIPKVEAQEAPDVSDANTDDELQTEAIDTTAPDLPDDASKLNILKVEAPEVSDVPDVPDVPSANEVTKADVDDAPDSPDDAPKVNVLKVEAQEVPDTPDIPSAADKLNALTTDAAPVAPKMNISKVSDVPSADEPNAVVVDAARTMPSDAMGVKVPSDISDVPGVSDVSNACEVEAKTIDAVPDMPGMSGAPKNMKVLFWLEKTFRCCFGGQEMTIPGSVSDLKDVDVNFLRGEYQALRI